MAEAEDLTQLHIADLHAKAAEAGVNGYRRLSREELIAEIEAGGKRKRSRWPRRKAPEVDPETETDELKIVGSQDDAEGADAPADPKPARRRGRRGGRGRGGRDREKLGGAGHKREEPESEETEEITGILEITRQRHGFLSVEGSDDDIYVSASQVRRCEMKEGDEVTGPVREPRRGERHRALVRVNLVNGEPPVDAPTPKKKSGGGAPPAGSPKAVEFKLVSVDGEECVVEVDGTLHTLEPGDRLSVAAGDGATEISRSEN